MNQKIKRFFKNGSPIALSIVGSIGVVVTAFLAVKETPKAIRLIQRDSKENHEGDENAFTKKEAFLSSWKCYIPAFISGSLTIMCILSSNILSRRNQASLASAYMLISEQYKQYKKKVIDKYGIDAHKEILKELAAEKAEEMSLCTVSGFFGDYKQLIDDSDNEDPTRLFYDSISDRYFQSSLSRVIAAEYCLNHHLTQGNYTPLNLFYDFLGIAKTEIGDDLFWEVTDEYQWIYFNHRLVNLDDGIECYIIEVENAPQSVSYYD